MKPFVTLLCAAALSGASFAAQAAPVQDQQRVAQELLRMAEQRRAAGDEAMARALAAQASLHQGSPALMPVEDHSFNRFMIDAEAMRRLELSQFDEGQYHELQSLGYLAVAEPAQDDVHATLREIRQELQALRAEVSALRAEMAHPRSAAPFHGGMTAPMIQREQGFYFVPAPSGQPEVDHFQGGFPSAPLHVMPGHWGGPGTGQGSGPGGASGAPQGSWQWVPAIPGQSAPHTSGPSAAPRGGGAWQRQHAHAGAAADATHAPDVVAAPAPPHPPAPPAVPRTPRTGTRSGEAARPQY